MRTDDASAAAYRANTPDRPPGALVFICPADLEYCARKACANRHCEKSGERPLDPCADCGTLVVVRGVGICVECSSAESAKSEEK